MNITSTVLNGEMSSDIFRKPINKHQYLSPHSCHPIHRSKTIPYSLSETHLLNKGEKPRQGLVNCGIILQREDTAI